MPPTSSVYRSFVTCSDPEGVIDCGSAMKLRLGKIENSIETRERPRSFNLSCSSTGEMRLADVVGNSSSPLAEIEKGAQKLNQMINSWASGMFTETQSKDIARGLLRGALELQESLTMLSRLQEGSFCMSRLKRLEKHKYESVWKERASVDGSIRSHCVDELTRVIRDTSARQTLLQVNQRDIPWASEVQSTSSSNTSVVFSKRVCSTDNSSVSSDTSHKRPNVIAKLMGLEDRKPVQATVGTSSALPKEKEVPARQAFDLDVPKARKPHHVDRKIYLKKKTLGELLEATHSKVRSEKIVEGLVPVLDQPPRTLHTNRRRAAAEEFPPIVIMKPIDTPNKESEKSHGLRFKSNKHGLGAASKRVKELKVMNWSSQAKDQVHERATLIQNEKSSIALRLTHETSKLPKLQSGKTKIKEKVAASTEQAFQVNKILETVKSPDIRNSRKISMKEKNVSVEKSLGSNDTSEAGNPDKNLRIIKSQTSSRQEVPPPKISKFTEEAARHCYSTDAKNTQKRKKKLSDTSRHKGAIAVDLSCQVSVGSLTDPLPVKKIIIPEEESEDNWRDVEVLHDAIHGDRNYHVGEDANCEMVTSDTSCFKSRSVLENLLLSSPSFTAHAELLFNLYPSVSEDVIPSINIEETDTSLFVSYANEVIERKSHQLSYVATSRNIPIFLHELLKEVCDAFEAIKNYKSGSQTVDILDILYRDMKCKEAVSSVWNLGWKLGYSAGETEHIASIIEKLILGDFIDELFVH
uniref:DUF4378 domain-containing protein n=1 Tax=Kalanchoe fedtschenkoi TaxID=63787 RepID=A0A7N0ZUI7_KALFE